MSPKILLPLATLFLVSPASAKDLRKRPGIGFNNQLGDMPSLSVKIGFPTSSPVVNFQIEGVVGVNIDTSNTNPDGICVGGRFLYGFVPEDNMNLYVTIGSAYISESDNSRIRLQPGLEAEVFLFGLENLGLSLGFGLNVDLNGTPKGISTFSAGPGFGVHYYF